MRKLSEIFPKKEGPILFGLGTFFRLGSTNSIHLVVQIRPNSTVLTLVNLTSSVMHTESKQVNPFNKNRLTKDEAVSLMGRDFENATALTNKEALEELTRRLVG